jgi:hypothetical protein
MSNENNTSSSSQENKSGARNLAEELDKATQKKSPSTTKNASWNFGDDEVEQDSGPVASQQQGNEQQAQQKPDANTPANSEDLRKGAETAAATVEFLASLLGEAIINIKYFFKFTADERERLDEEILDKPDSKRTEDEQVLASKFNRLMARRDEKLKNVKVSDTARKRMIDGFTDYAKITGKPPMNPKMLPWVTVSEIALKTVMNAALD